MVFVVYGFGNCEHWARYIYSNKKVYCFVWSCELYERIIEILYFFVSWVRASVQSEKCFWSFVHHFIRIPYTIRMSHIKPSVYIDHSWFWWLNFSFWKKETHSCACARHTWALFFLFILKIAFFFCILFYPKIKSNRYCPHVSLY